MRRKLSEWGPATENFIARHQVMVAIVLSILLVLASVLGVLMTVNMNGQSDFGVMSSIPPDAEGVALLGHIYKIDVQSRIIGVSWYVGGCGSYKMVGAAIAKGTSNCGISGVPIDIYMDGKPEPVHSYDPELTPRDAVTGIPIYLQSLNQFQTELLLEIYTQAMRLGQYRYFDQQYLYPFDYYVTKTTFVTLDSSTNTTVPIVSASFSDFVDNFAPISVNTASRTRFNGTEFDSNVISLTISRNPVARVYSMMLFIFNWALTAVVMCITVVATIAKEVELGEGVLILPVTVILTIPALRELFVGEPPVGILLDIVGFFLQMLTVALCTVILLARTISVAPKGTGPGDGKHLSNETIPSSQLPGISPEKTALLSYQMPQPAVPSGSQAASDSENINVIHTHLGG